MKTFRANLHVHTALSPCADDAMTPPALAEAAVVAGLDLIAVCDHNTADNVAAVQAAAGAAVAVIAGMEVTTSEEVHVVGLFPDVAAAGAAGAAVGATLPESAGDTTAYGDALLMDAGGQVLGKAARVLSAASGFSLEATVALIHAHGGLAVAAHVDRPSFSVTSQLGLFPEGLRFDAIEISAAGVRAGRDAAFAGLGFPMITGSDAHFLCEVGAGQTTFEMDTLTLAEIALTLRGAGGRRCYFA